MKSLKQIVNEGLFKNVGIGTEAIRQDIERWINEYFICQNLKVDLDNNKWIANAKSVKRRNTKTNDITSITNGKFTWGNINGGFDLDWCSNLVDLEGAPRECSHMDLTWCKSLKNFKGLENSLVLYDLDCSMCLNLESFEGAPDVIPSLILNFNKKLNSFKGLKKINKLKAKNNELITDLVGLPRYISTLDIKDFTALKTLKGAPDKCEYLYIENCTALKDLKGAPKMIRNNIYLINNPKLESLEGCPDKCFIFKCNDNEKLKSLKGCPKECEEFDCRNNGGGFTVRDIRRECNVRYKLEADNDLINY